MNKVVTYTLDGQTNQTKMNPEELAQMEQMAAKFSNIKIVKVEIPRRRRSR